MEFWEIRGKTQLLPISAEETTPHILRCRPPPPTLTITQDNAECFMGLHENLDFRIWFIWSGQYFSSGFYYWEGLCLYWRCSRNWKTMNYSFVPWKNWKQEVKSGKLNNVTTVIQLSNDRAGGRMRVSGFQASIIPLCHMLVLLNGGVSWHLRAMFKKFNTRKK